MSRIEISLKEYDELKKKIRQLEANNVALSREIEKQKGMIDELEDHLSELTEIGLIDRIFNWDQYVTPVKTLLPERKNG